MAPELHLIYPAKEEGMDKGIYVAMTGAALRMNELDNISSNLANISTSGYKRAGFAARLYPLLEGVSTPQSALYPGARGMTVLDKYTVDQSSGVITTTGNPLDLAIKGEGYFSVDVKGQKRYTRNGAFAVDRDGYIVTGGGYKVLGTDDKPVRISRDKKSAPDIGLDGTVTADGNAVGMIKLVKLSDVKAVSDSLYSGKETGASDGEIMQGNLERSNVNPMRELVGMVVAQREFQTLQQLIKTFDQLAQRTTDIAKIA
jgi:flagellar basal-body rod protein FlgG